MFITVGQEQVELKTTLGTIRNIEKKYNRTPVDIFANLDKATTQEMVDILLMAAVDAPDKKALEATMYDEWGYMQLTDTTAVFVLNLLFPGTVEDQAKQIDAASFDDATKNEMRARLGLPIPQAPAGIGNE